ncbi:MAG: hypothetical protein AB2L11_10000 [Syntrophobacteraceae bacterium]
MEHVYPGAEGYHAAPKDDANFNESYFFHFYDPKTTLGGCLRWGVLENQKESNLWFYLFKNKKVIYHRFSEAHPYTPKRMLDGIEVAGVRCTTIEPTKKCLIECSLPQCSVSLTFTGTAPMADAIAMTMGVALDPAAVILAGQHLEGPARFSGTVDIRGEKTEIVDGFAFRDVSFGSRDWAQMVFYRLSWPVFQDGRSPALIHAVVGEKRAYMKMFWDGKQWLQVKDVEDDIEYAEDGQTALSCRYRFWDENDKMWEFTGKHIFTYKIPLNGYVSCMNCMEYRFSDGTVGYGQLECGFVLPWDEKFFTPGPKRKG